MSMPAYHKLRLIFAAFVATSFLVLLPGCSGTSTESSEPTEVVTHVQETESDDYDYDYDYEDDDRRDDGSSSLDGTTTTLGDGTVMTYGNDGTIYYENPDGSLEVTDGWGNVVKDVDGDGMADSYSIDGGESWGYL